MTKATPDTGSALEQHLSVSLVAAGAPPFVREHRFHPTRKWRLDFCWPEQMLAVELEGGGGRGRPEQIEMATSTVVKIARRGRHCLHQSGPVHHESG